MLQKIKDTIIAPLFASPHRFSGGVVVNVLGFQFLRFFWYQYLSPRKWMRSRFVTPAIAAWADTLNRDGVVAIPNFLPEEEFNKIRKEFDAIRPSIELKPNLPSSLPPGTKAQVYKGRFDPRQSPALLALIQKNFLKNDDMRRLRGAETGTWLKHWPKLVIFVNENRNPEARDYGSASCFHSDSPAPSVKMFYYLADVDEKNGAFTYAKGSNHVWWQRLFFEYRKSIACARYAHNKGYVDQHNDMLGIHCPSSEDERRLGLVETPMVGKKNTLVMFNVMGYHKQGRFSDNRSREFIEISDR